MPLKSTLDLSSVCDCVPLPRCWWFIRFSYTYIMYSPLPTDIWGTFFRIYTRFNGRTVASSANIQHSFVSPENFSSHFPNYLQPIARLSACLSPPTRCNNTRAHTHEYVLAARAHPSPIDVIHSLTHSFGLALALHLSRSISL